MPKVIRRNACNSLQSPGGISVAEMDRSPLREGVPSWLLYTVTPVILALGFLAGMAIAAYLPGQLPGPGTALTASSLPDDSWRIPTHTDAQSAATGPAAQPPLPAKPGPQAAEPEPAAPAFRGPATDIREARLALSTDYRTYQDNGVYLTFDYQQLRDTTLGTSLVGMISAADYSAWEAALRMNPTGLKAWLVEAARRVQAASIRDRFHVAWAVVDVVRDRPDGFADYELTPLENRTYLVTRPLAATLDHTKPDISLRPLDSLSPQAATIPTAVNGPWAAYGPVIRFDSTDLYRPVRAVGTRPVR